MAERYKFQFSILNSRTRKSLGAIPRNYRGLFIEMALKAWFSENSLKDTAKLSLNTFTSEKLRAHDASRIRVTISNKTIISGLLATPRRRRSFVAELALMAWMPSKPGKVAFEMLTSKGKEQSTDSVEEAAAGNEGEAKVDEFFNLDDGEASETERLIKGALAFK